LKYIISNLVLVCWIRSIRVKVHRWKFSIVGEKRC